MNENIDIRMSNYLKIVSNEELKKQFDLQTVMAMEKALVIYTSTTAAKYISDYENKKIAEKVNAQFAEYEDTVEKAK